jgi:AraC family transcriptional regulator
MVRDKTLGHWTRFCDISGSSFVRRLRQGENMLSTTARDLHDWVTRSAVSNDGVRTILAEPVLDDGLRLSSRSLGWRGLGFDQYQIDPGSWASPENAGRHLIFLGLGQALIARDREEGLLEHELRPGSIVLCPAGSAIRWSARTRVRCCVLALDATLLDRVAAGIYGAAAGDFDLIPTEREYDFGIVGLAGILAEEAMRGVPGNNLYVNSLANILAVHLLRNYAKWLRNGPESESRTALERALSAPEPVQRAVVFIRQNHTRDVGLREIADAARMSSFHLARLFKERLGISPYQYLLHLRVQSAKSLLAAGAGMHSLAEVALAVGFSDQSHLTRHFKRVLGVTPGRAMNGVNVERAGLNER